MYLLESTPKLLLVLYKLTGSVQFSTSTSSTRVENCLSRLWSIPCYVAYLYISYKSAILFQTIQFTGLFKYFDLFIAYSSWVLMVTCVISFNKRSNKLKHTLVKISSLNLPTSQRKTHSWIRPFFVTLVAINIALCGLVEGMPTVCMLHMFIPVAITSLDHLYFHDLMTTTYGKFEEINRHFQRKLYSIYQIKHLCHTHYELVTLSKKINKCFEITTLVGIVPWFGIVLNGIYYVPYVTLNNIGINLIGFTIFTTISLLYYFFWLFLMVWMSNKTQKEVKMV